MVTVVDIVEDQAMMTMGTEGLQGARHIEVGVITPLGDHRMVEGQEGSAPGPTLLTVVLKGTMLVALGETCCLVLAL